MSNVKIKFSLSFVMLLVLIMSLGSVFAVDRIFNLSATYNGKALTDGQTIEVGSSDSRTINISVNPTYTNTLQIGYKWDSDAIKIAAEGSKTATITIPNYAEGSTHTLKLEAIINDKTNNYIGNSNVVTITVEIPKTTTADVSLKDGSTTVKEGATIEKEAGSRLVVIGSSNKTIKQVAYRWNSEELKTVNAASATITVPSYAAGSTNKLAIQAVTEDGVYSAGKTYTVKIPAEVVVPQTTVSVAVTRPSTTTVKMQATVVNSTFSKFLYHWDNEADKTLTVNPATITIPTTAGTHVLTVKAVAADGTTGSTTYSVVVAAAPQTTVVVAVTRPSTTTVKMQATVTNSTFSKFLYHWNNEADKTLTVNPATITIPTTVGTHTLTVKAVAADGTTGTRTYSVTVAAPVELDDELIVETWMKEDNDMEELAVSLRNDSDEIEKGNKNFYALNEEIVYYVDYKNGGDDITKEVKLVLELPLNFKIIDAYGGTVNSTEKTITWTFADGLEEDQAGTKVVKVAYTGFERKSKKYEIVYPVADIYQRNKVVDSSAVINYIFKDEETEITDEHYPYMFGDNNATTFRPDDTITRAEGALVLTRIFGIDTSGTKVEALYPDLGETYLEAQKAIVAATKLGLINGYTDGTYKPNNKMTKAEFMKIIASYIEANAEDEDIRGLEVKTDTNIKIYKNPKNMYVTGTTTVNQHWASDWVTMLVRLNMTPVSSSSKNLGLDEEITRAEVAQLVNFYLLRAPADVTSSTKTQFSDVSKKHDLFEDIVEATRGEHIYTLTQEGYEVAVDED